MKEISRNVVEGESLNDQQANFDARVAMAPHAEDLIQAMCEQVDGRSGARTIARERGKRANILLRQATYRKMEWEHNLRSWSEAIRCLVAVTWGAVSFQSSEIGALIELCLSKPRLGYAKAVMQGFALGQRQMSWLESRVVKALREIVEEEDHQVVLNSIRQAATLAGLVTQNTVWETEQEYCSVSVGEFDLEAFLAEGFATFDHTALPEVLNYWTALANPNGEHASKLTEWSHKAILSWARQEMDNAWGPNGNSTPPNANVFVDADENTLQLTWDGTFTASRGFSAVITFDQAGWVRNVFCSWSTGTGRPSKFMQIESLLDEVGLQEYGQSMVN